MQIHLIFLNQKYNQIGISPPEFLGNHFKEIKDYLEKRDVKYKMIKKS